MNQKSKLRLTVLCAALATTAVFAGTYAAIGEPQQPTPIAASSEGLAASETVIATPQEAVTTTQAEAPVADLSTPAEPAKIAAPAPETTVAEPAITVTEQRLTEDQRIQLQVMDKLANNPTLSGKVGVETHDQVVNLSGSLTTNGMVMRAGRDAGSVVGVRYVVNEIRTKIGPVTY